MISWVYKNLLNGDIPKHIPILTLETTRYMARSYCGKHDGCKKAGAIYSHHHSCGVYDPVTS